MDRNTFAFRLQTFWETMPSAALRRTYRGVLATCRHLGNHKRKALQLYGHTESDEDERSVDELIAHIEKLRSELADGDSLRTAVQRERGGRRLRRLHLSKIPR